MPRPPARHRRRRRCRRVGRPRSTNSHSTSPSTYMTYVHVRATAAQKHQNRLLTNNSQQPAPSLGSQGKSGLRKPSLSRHHASPEAPTVGRRSVVVRDDGTSDASQKLGARGATARETALTSEFTSKTLTFDRSKLRPRRATRAEKRCVRKPRAERTNFPELARELGRRDAQ